MTQERFVWAVDFSPDGKRVVGTTAQGQAIVWDTTSYEPLGKPLSAIPGGVQFAYYQPRRPVPADARQPTGRSSCATRSRTSRSGHRSSGTGARSSPSGPLSTPTARGWSPPASTGRPSSGTSRVARRSRDPWPGGEGGSASPDGRLIVTLVGEHILLWDADTDRWAGIACRAAGRSMTPEEWEEFGPADEEYRATCR